MSSTRKLELLARDEMVVVRSSFEVGAIWVTGKSIVLEIMVHEYYTQVLFSGKEDLQRQGTLSSINNLLKTRAIQAQALMLLSHM